jgi:hypothetical protein
MEEQNEKITFPIVDPLKIEVKDEINDNNPWSVEHASAFLKYCCPECEYNNGTFKSFKDHAFQNHENAKVFFTNEEHQNLQSNPIKQEGNELGLDDILLIDKDKPKPTTTAKVSKFTLKELQDTTSAENLCSIWQDYSDIETPKAKKSNNYLTLSEKREIIQLYENGTKISKIAKDKEMPGSSVHNICKRKDKYKFRSEQSSSGNVIRFRAQSKKYLTLAEKLEIIQLYENGTKTSQIGKAKGIPESSVRLICKKKDKYKAQSEQVTIKKPKKLNIYICYTCGLKMQGRKEYDLHEQNCVQMCEICSTEFADSQLFKLHIADKHITGGQYSCVYCDLKFKGWVTMKYHTDVKHIESGEKSFFCLECQKGFSYQSNLKRHNYSHVKQAKYVCEICAKEYKKLISLNIHMAKNHNTGKEPMLICDKCDYSAPHHELLQKHIRHKHEVDKHKKCPCCDFKTPQVQKLYIHIDVRHPDYDEKKLFCDKCGKSFIYELSLKQHVNFECKFSDYIRKVKNPRKKLKTIKKIEVKCDYCLEILCNSEKIKLHYKRTHPNLPIILDGIEKFPCSHCKDFFFCKVSLEKHSHMEHGIETGKKYCKKCSKPYTIQHTCQKVYSYPCDHCHMAFKSKLNLKSHILSVHEKRLDFACEYCGKKWPTLQVLKGHVKGTHTQKVKCEICDKKISNPIELRRHKVFVHKQTEGAWLCEKCPKSAFFSKSTFEKHMKTKH